MADLNATNSSNGSVQTTTQSPQTSAPDTGPGAQAAGIQPGTASDLLRNTNGIALKNTPVTTVNLSSVSDQSAPASTVKPHHINAGLLVISIVLFVVAVGLFWSTSRSVNKTTY